MTSSLIEKDIPSIAVDYLRSGLSVVPTLTDGTKKPTMAWRGLQHERMPEQVASDLFHGHGIAVIGGKVSGDLEIVDFDAAGALFEQWRADVEKMLPGLTSRLVIERTPRGGFHAAYRATGMTIPGNLKLACMPDGECAIETRGEGGYALCAPTPGYTLVQGDWLSLPVITKEERDVLISVAQALDAKAKSAVGKSVRAQRRERPTGEWKGKTVADDFRERGDVRRLLERHGWSSWRAGPDGEWWTRPGKDCGVSGTLFDGGPFYVFSSNAKPLDSGRAYSPFDLYAALEHGGDRSATARTLYAQGYGDRQHRVESPLTFTTMADDDAPPESAPAFERPSWNEVLEAVGDSPLRVYMEEAGRVSHDLPGEAVLADALQLAGCCLARSRIRIGVSKDDLAPVECNVYVLKLIASGGGKGLSSSFLRAAAHRLELAELMGSSDAALVARAEKTPGGAFGLCYENEISRILDSRNPVATLVTTLFLKAYDEGRLIHVTCPRGHYVSRVVEPAAPSLLIEGQPDVFESAAGRSAISTGLLARLLTVAPPYRRIRKEGWGDVGRVARSYQAYMPDHERVIVAPRGVTSKRIEPILGSLSDGELAAWGRLEGQYLLRFALMLEPTAIMTGHLSDDAMRRAMVLCEWFFAGARYVMGLCHDDRGEVLRARMVRYIAGHPDCSDRDLYRHLKCSSLDFTRTLAPTVIARGDANRSDRGRWIAVHAPAIDRQPSPLPSETTTANLEPEPVPTAPEPQEEQNPVIIPEPFAIDEPETETCSDNEPTVHENDRF